MNCNIHHKNQSQEPNKSQDGSKVVPGAPIHQHERVGRISLAAPRRNSMMKGAMTPRASLDLIMFRLLRKQAPELTLGDTLISTGDAIRIANVISRSSLRSLRLDFTHLTHDSGYAILVSVCRSSTITQLTVLGKVNQLRARSIATTVLARGPPQLRTVHMFPSEIDAAATHELVVGLELSSFVSDFTVELREITNPRSHEAVSKMRSYIAKELDRTVIFEPLSPSSPPLALNHNSVPSPPPQPPSSAVTSRLAITSPGAPVKSPSTKSYSPVRFLKATPPAVKARRQMVVQQRVPVVPSEKSQSPLCLAHTKLPATPRGSVRDKSPTRHTKLERSQRPSQSIFEQCHGNVPETKFIPVGTANNTGQNSCHTNDVLAEIDRVLNRLQESESCRGAQFHQSSTCNPGAANQIGIVDTAVTHPAHLSTIGKNGKEQSTGEILRQPEQPSPSCYVFHPATNRAVCQKDSTAAVPRKDCPNAASCENKTRGAKTNTEVLTADIVVPPCLDHPEWHQLRDEVTKLSNNLTQMCYYIDNAHVALRESFAHAVKCPRLCDHGSHNANTGEEDNQVISGAM